MARFSPYTKTQIAGFFKIVDCRVCGGRGTIWQESFDGHRSDFYEERCPECERKAKESHGALRPEDV